jgi:hypothetical protein
VVGEFNDAIALFKQEAETVKMKHSRLIIIIILISY